MKDFKAMRRKTKKALEHLPEDALKAGKKAGRKAGETINEFKEFISRGNVTDLAVGVIVGTSFTAIVNALAHDVLMPLIGTLMGGIDLTELSFTVNSPIFADYSVTIAYGKFLQAVVTFLIIAVSVFFMIKVLNVIRRKKDEEEEAGEPDKQIALLTEIRDLLREQRFGADASKTDASKADEICAVIPELSPSEIESND